MEWSGVNLWIKKMVIRWAKESVQNGQRHVCCETVRKKMSEMGEGRDIEIEIDRERKRECGREGENVEEKERMRKRRRATQKDGIIEEGRNSTSGGQCIARNLGIDTNPTDGRMYCLPTARRQT